MQAPQELQVRLLQEELPAAGLSPSQDERGRAFSRHLTMKLL